MILITCFYIFLNEHQSCAGGALSLIVVYISQ